VPVVTLNGMGYDIARARAGLKRYLRDGAITLSPDLGPDGEAAYVARAEFLPLMTENAEALRGLPGRAMSMFGWAGSI
jgi:hypothetical protein